VALQFFTIASLPAAAQPLGWETAREKGVMREHGPISFAPWDQIDPWSGNAMLSFEDLSLIGNAGFNLTVRRVYNTKDGGSWTFDIGMPRMWFVAGMFPRIVNGDGSITWLVRDVSDQDLFHSTTFWRYRASTRTLQAPTGVTYMFDTAGNPLSAADPFGNQQLVTWDGGRIAHIVQTLGNDQNRQLDFEYDGQGNISSLSCQGRSWHYTWSGYMLTEAAPPAGPSWTFGYSMTVEGMENESAITVTTPTGGWVRYAARRHVDAYPNGYDPRWDSFTLRSRQWGGTGVAGGELTFSYPANGTPTTTITGAGGVTYHAVFTFSPTTYWTVPLTSVSAGSPGAEQQTSLTWDDSGALGVAPTFYAFPSVPLSPTTALLLQTATVTQSGRSYTRTYGYPFNPITTFGQPDSVEDTGEFTHSTFLLYWTFPGTSNLAPKPMRVTVDGNSGPFVNYADTGFATLRTVGNVTTTFTPDAYGNVHVQNVAETQQTTFEHSWGVVSAITAPQSAVVLGINPDGTVATAAENGHTTSYLYDAAGRPITMQPPLGNATTTTYADGRSITTSRRTAWSTVCLDAFGRTAFTFDSTGARSDVEYDALGRIVRRTLPYTTDPAPSSCSSPAAPAPPSVHFTYDELGRLTTRTNANGTYATYQYDSTPANEPIPGLRVTMTEHLGGNPEVIRTTTKVLQASGTASNTRLRLLTNADGQPTSYEYDDSGQLFRVTGPDLRAKTWGYDANSGQLRSEAQPPSGTVTYTYDALGRLATRKDALANTLTYAYDASNRVNGVTSDLDSTYNSTFDYDASGNRLLASNGYVTTRFEYDAVNRLKTRTDEIAGHRFETHVEYDDVTNRVVLTYPSGNHVTYDLDSNDRVWRVYDDPRGLEFARDFHYRPSGAIASYTSGNGIVNTVEYDPNTEQPINIASSGGVLDLTYDYHGAGTVKSITDTRAGMSTSYTYDLLDQLLTASGPWGSLVYVYDTVGNRTSSTLNAAETIYHYDTEGTSATGRLLSTSWGLDQHEWFDYDANGRLTSDARASTYGYTPAGQLALAAMRAGITHEYRYDADGQRVLKVEPTSSSYVVNELSEFLVPANEPIRWTVDYVYADSRLLAAVKPATGTTATLTVQKSGAGVGRVSGSGGLDCGTACTAAYVTGTPVTLAAEPEEQSWFTGWGGSCSGTEPSTQVTVDAATTCTAIFAARRNLTVTLAGTGAGTVTAEGLTCDGTACAGWYEPNTVVAVTATAATGSFFTGWTGAGCGSSVTMSSDRDCAATFDRVVYTLAVQKIGDDIGDSWVTSDPSGIDCGPTCAASMGEGTTVTLTAYAADGYQFVGWQGTGCVTGTVTMTAARTCTAVFEPVSGCDPDGSQQMECEGRGNRWDFETCSCQPLWEDPLILRLDGKPIQLTDPTGGVSFDLDGTGVRKWVSWTHAGSTAGFLVLDLDGDGRITTGAELFGMTVGAPRHQKPAAAENSFMLLAAYDTPALGGNGDGMINAADAVFSRLRLWVDANHDGVSQPEELISLATAGIVSIELSYRTTSRCDGHRNYFRYRGAVHLTSGRTVPIWDVFLGTGSMVASSPDAAIGTEATEDPIAFDDESAFVETSRTERTGPNPVADEVAGAAFAEPDVTPTPYQVVEYFHLDAIGSVRAVTDAQGHVLRRHDFLPFGDEVSPQIPPVDQKLFTGQERDFETAFDYFHARQLRTDLGRFTAPDPLTDQAWTDGIVGATNAYGYVRNSPLVFVDPDGRDAIFVNFSNGAPISGRGFGHNGVAVVYPNGSVVFADFAPTTKQPIADGKVTKLDLTTRITFDSIGRPTTESLAALAAELEDREDAPAGSVRLAGFETSFLDDLVLENWMRESLGSWLWKKWIVTGNNCADYTREGLFAGGVGWGRAFPLIPAIPNEDWTWFALWSDWTYTSPRAVVTTSEKFRYQDK
jgi:RHS repeat-associated protein